MKADLLKSLLLIEEPSVYRLYQEFLEISRYLLAPAFLLALIFEYFGEFDFLGVVKKLFIITFIMNFFHEIHVHSSSMALNLASETLERVSPRNIFLRKWQESKFKPQNPTNGSFYDSFVVPNVNDLVATAFYLISKIMLWLLKLIYSTVYHFTYLFSGITSVLFLFGWTRDALRGTVQSFVWCLILPFVVVSILALVGNSFDDKANSGVIVSQIDTLAWLFGVTLLLSMSPVISYGLVKGEGMQSVGSKLGSMVTSTGLKTAAYTASAVTLLKRSQENKKKLSALREKAAAYKEWSAKRDQRSHNFSQGSGGASPSASQSAGTTKGQGSAAEGSSSGSYVGKGLSAAQTVGQKSIQAGATFSKAGKGYKIFATTSVPSLKAQSSKSPESISTKSPSNPKGREVVELQHRNNNRKSKVKIQPRNIKKKSESNRHELQ